MKRVVHLVMLSGLTVALTACGSSPVSKPISATPAAVAGQGYTLALKHDGTVWAWGADNSGQLGDGTTTASRTTPVQVAGPGGTGTLTGITAIAAGDHALALKSDGTVWAWGPNTSGQLGDGTTTSRNAPVQVVGSGGSGTLTGITAIAADTHSLALKSNGTVWAWGPNTSGQLGDGTTTSHNAPVQVVGSGGSGTLDNITAIAAGYGYSLALDSNGTVWAWGWNTVGQLGDGTTTTRNTPVQVAGPGGTGTLANITAIAADDHSLALKSDGTVWAWGDNDHGEVGDGTQTARNAPVQVAGALTGITTIAAGGDHSLALKSDGTVWAWGWNGDGELGDGTTTNRSTPVKVGGLSLSAVDGSSLQLPR